MRNSVPFVGEQQISRADTEQAKQKRQSGLLIDELISTADAESSWDDIVPDSWSGRRSNALHPTPSVRKPPVLQPLTGQQLVQGTKTGSNLSVNKASSLIKTGAGLAACVDWVPFNSGHGLRINVTGNIDHNLREEWRRLLHETAETTASEYEVNLTATPALSMTGLGMLLLFKERKCPNREAVKLSNCNHDVWRLLNWTGMDKYFVIVKSGDFK